MRRLFQAAFPGAFVFALAIGALAWPVSAAVVPDMVATYGRVVYGAGLALAWVFHRSRVFVVLLSMGLLDIALADSTDRSVDLVAFGTVLVSLIGVLAVTRDRGLTSPAGSIQLATGAIFALFAAVVFDEPAFLSEFVDPPSLAVGDDLASGLPKVTVALALCSCLAVSYGYYRWRGPVERALIWCVVLVAIAIHPLVSDSASALFLLAAGLTLTLSVVETSYMLAYRDDLTGLPGRRALMQYVDGMTGMYTIAMVDVDHFKKFNDKHGHDVGDQVLRLVATHLGRAPGGGKAYRYGGEEFTLLYPGRMREEALPHLEAVRESIEQARFSVRSWKRPKKKPDEKKKKKTTTRKPKSLSVTVSLGMADASGDDDTPEVVLKRADEALYRAKKKGRNRVSK